MALASKLYLNSDSRSSERLSFEIDATLRTADDRPLDASVEELSDSGFRMVCAKNLSVGATASIGIAGLGRQQFTVIRLGDGYIACQFAVPLSRYRAALDTSVDPVLWLNAGTRLASAVQPNSDLHLRSWRGVIITTGILAPWILAAAISKLAL